MQRNWRVGGQSRKLNVSCSGLGAAEAGETKGDLPTHCLFGGGHNTAESSASSSAEVIRSILRLSSTKLELGTSSPGTIAVVGAWVTAREEAAPAGFFRTAPSALAGDRLGTGTSPAGTSAAAEADRFFNNLGGLFKTAAEQGDPRRTTGALAGAGLRPQNGQQLRCLLGAVEDLRGVAQRN
eukprot:RCo037894